jgi:hypothetical protein
MNIIDQCRDAIGGKLYIRKGGTVDRFEVVETVLAEFARLVQSEEMVEKVYAALATDYEEPPSCATVRAVLAALFRETGVTT